MPRIWDKYLPERDRKLIDGAGYRSRMGFGSRPALLVIDVNYNFTGDRREPIEEAIKRWPNACGEAAWDAMPRIKALLDLAHEKQLPVFFSTDGFREDGWNMGSWRWKTARSVDERATARTSNLRGADINDEVAPIPSDIIIEKLKPSVFNGTPLRQLLTLLKVDTLVVAGTTTSGCVRASVIDAFSDNYRVILAEDGCFDRVELSHAVNLFDMDAKYADVLNTDEILSELARFQPGLFELPKGA
jgi:nicotinamidase-related amidase